MFPNINDKQSNLHLDNELKLVISENKRCFVNSNFLLSCYIHKCLKLLSSNKSEYL